MMLGEAGIERINAYVPMFSLALDDLARVRGVDPEKYRSGLGVETMAIAPPFEDAVTLGANAAAPLFERGFIDRDEIGLLLVGTESAVDHAKPVSIFVHDLLKLRSACRAYELKHACFGGTAALMTAAQWIASGAARGRKALVIATDVARYELGSAGEPTQGAGAVAMVVSASPSLFALDYRRTGSYAESVYDFWRPLDRREALVDGKYSVDCYLRALAGAYADARRALELDAAARFAERHRAFLYHTPFPKMAWKAHRHFAAVDAPRGASDDQIEERARRTFAEEVSPYLASARAVGNTYTASLYFCLADLLERDGGRLAGERISLFSYGSGCCAELFAGVVGPAAPRADAGLAPALGPRLGIDVETYEAIRRAGEPDGETPPPEGFGGRFFYAGSRADRRRYESVS